MNKTPARFLLDAQPFAKTQAKHLTERDKAALKALCDLGGRITAPAELAAALSPKATASQKTLTGGRLVRRLESFAFVSEVSGSATGFEITLEGKRAAAKL